MNSLSVELREIAHLGKRTLHECREARFGNLVSLATGAVRKSKVRLTKNRAFHAYCIGAPRTGTTTAAGFLRDYYRARHEIDSEDVLGISFDRLDGKASDEEFRQFVRDRDRRLFLEMDSSSHNYYLVPVLVEMFPDSKFLLPVREPVSWLNSYIDYGINYRLRVPAVKRKDHMPQRQRMDQFRYGNVLTNYSPGEELLEEHGMPSVEAFLKLYRDHHVNLLEWIPEERRLIYNSLEFDQNVGQICEFLGADQSRLTMTTSHMNSSRKKHRVTDKLDPGFLASKLDEYCAGLQQAMPIAPKDHGGVAH